MNAEIDLAMGIEWFDAPGDRAANLERAIEHLSRAVEAFAKDRAIDRWGVAHYELGLAYGARIRGDRRTNLITSIAHYREARRVLHGDPDRYAMVAQNLGSVLADLVALDPLEQTYSLAAMAAGRDAMNAQARRGNPVDWASAANNLATIYRDALHGSRAEQLDEAVDLHEAALAVFTAGSAGVDKATELRRDDNPYWNDELVRRAPSTRESLQQGQEVYTRRDFLQDRAWTLGELGNTLVARMRGDRAKNLEAAINAHLETMRLQEELGDLQGQARTANNLGHAYRERLLGVAHENWEAGIAFYRRAVELHRRAGSSPFTIAQSEQNLGTTLLFFARKFPELPHVELEESIALLRNSLRVRTRTDYPYYWAMTTSMLAVAHLHRDDVDEALRLFEEALDVRALRDAAPEKWLQIKTHQGRAYLRAANPEKAAECFRTAIGGDDDFDARLGLADALAQLGRQSEARELLRQSVERIEVARAAAEWSQSKRHWSVQSTLFLDQLVALSWAESPGEALRWSEFGRGRALADVQVGRRRQPANVSAEEFETYVELQELHVDLERRLGVIADEGMRGALLQRMKEARASQDALERAFRAADPEWSPAAAPLTLAELLAVEVPVLVIRINPDATYAWLLRPGQPLAARRFDAPKRDDVRRILIRWLTAYVTDALAESMEAQLGELWQVLIAEVHAFAAESLRPGEDAPLIVVASQALGVLPLHAAWRVVDGERRFWCDDYAIGYAPSIASLRAARRIGTSPSLLAVADPTAELPWAEIEATQVRKSFDGPSSLLRGPAATRQAVLAELALRPQTILFSCHGRWDADAPWFRAGLLLADTQLTLRDISAADLSRCHLAILSACETGMSDAADPADEFIGLPATFLAAGASTVVGSLWSVDDATTALLITHAFSGQPTHPLTRLHAAQKWLRNADVASLRAAVGRLEVDEEMASTFAERGERPCAHPYWWAALTCVGLP